MKILVLMPCDEKMAYYAAKIYEELPNSVKDNTFSMPLFMDYLISSKIVGNWIYAFFDSFVSMKNLYKAALKDKDDLVIFGTAPRDFKFDAIFNFQDAEESLPYEDKFLTKIKDIVKNEGVLYNPIRNLYDKEDSIFTLQNCKATAQFIADYLKTDPHLEDIKERYKDTLKFKGDEEDGISSAKN